MAAKKAELVRGPKLISGFLRPNPLTLGGLCRWSDVKLLNGTRTMFVFLLKMIVVLLQANWPNRAFKV